MVRLIYKLIGGDIMIGNSILMTLLVLVFLVYIGLTVYILCDFIKQRDYDLVLLIVIIGSYLIFIRGALAYFGI